MSRKYCFKTVVSNKVYIKDLVNPISLFEDNNNIEPIDGLRNKSEDYLSQWILNQEFFISELKRDIGHLVPTKDYKNVTKPFTNHDSVPGDIDIIFVPPDEPNKTTAFQVKSVKVKVTGKENGTMGITNKINKLEGLSKGVTQSNNMHKKFHFYQSYFMLVIVEDCSEVESVNVITRKANDSVFKNIQNFLEKECLDNEVGLIYVALTKLTREDYDNMHKIGYCIVRNPKRCEQESATTEKICELLKMNITE